MKEEKINRTVPVKTIIIAPLDWGLGHATRCIPIIRDLLEQKFNVLLAAEGSIANLMLKEFPALTILPLRGYRITYAPAKGSFVSHLLLQFPRVLSTIRYENKWLAKMVKLYNVDAVISDNRFGLYHPTVHCYFITHQLHIETGINFLNKLAQKINYRFINRFTACWVPDDQRNLAGKLSHPNILPKAPLQQLGLLSRFTYSMKPKTIDLLFLLSGPEPQRSIFEKLIVESLAGYSQKAVIVRGLPMVQEELYVSGVTVFNHLPAAPLAGLIQQTRMVICRPGYSTLMDLSVLKQKAIIIPTPGQTEQEYLAEFLTARGLFLSCRQEKFELETMLRSAEVFSWKAHNEADNAGLKIAISQL